MPESIPQCLICQQSEQDIPLLPVQYRGQQYWICPQHLPVLIHRPEELAGKLPGAEQLSGYQH